MRPADIKTARSIVQKPFKEEVKNEVKAEVKEEVKEEVAEEKPRRSRRRSKRKHTSSSTTASDSGLATSPRSTPSTSPRPISPDFEVSYAKQPKLWVYPCVSLGSNLSFNNRNCGFLLVFLYVGTFHSTTKIVGSVEKLLHKFLLFHSGLKHVCV